MSCRLRTLLIVITMAERVCVSVCSALIAHEKRKEDRERENPFRLISFSFSFTLHLLAMHIPYGVHGHA